MGEGSGVVVAGWKSFVLIDHKDKNQWIISITDKSRNTIKTILCLSVEGNTQESNCKS